MRIHPDVTLGRVTEAVERGRSSLDNPGFCVCCGGRPKALNPTPANTSASRAGSPASTALRSCCFIS